MKTGVEITAQINNDPYSDSSGDHATTFASPHKWAAFRTGNIDWHRFDIDVGIVVFPFSSPACSLKSAYLENMRVEESARQ